MESPKQLPCEQLQLASVNFSQLQLTFFEKLVATNSYNLCNNLRRYKLKWVILSFVQFWKKYFCAVSVFFISNIVGNIILNSFISESKL